jgi:hypothetical protein
MFLDDTFSATAAAVALLLLAAAIACVPPTIRAMRVDPVMRMEQQVPNPRDDISI